MTHLEREMKKLKVKAFWVHCKEPGIRVLKTPTLKMYYPKKQNGFDRVTEEAFYINKFWNICMEGAKPKWKRL